MEFRVSLECGAVYLMTFTEFNRLNLIGIFNLAGEQIDPSCLLSGYGFVADYIFP